MSHVSQYFFVLPNSEVTSDMVDESMNLVSTYRKCLDGGCAILKFTEEAPTVMSGYTSKTHEEMHQYLEDNKEHWEDEV